MVVVRWRLAGARQFFNHIYRHQSLESKADDGWTSNDAVSRPDDAGQ
jgi:hypothetical protein